MLWLDTRTSHPHERPCMSDSSRRKHERAVARRHKLADREKRRQTVATDRQAALDYERSYPGIVFETRTAPPEFVALVRAAVGAIDFRDRQLFSDQEAAFWRTVHAKGARAAGDEFASAQTGGRGWWEPGPDNWHRKLGELVFRLIPRDHLLRFAPYHDYL